MVPRPQMAARRLALIPLLSYVRAAFGMAREGSCLSGGWRGTCR